MFKAYFDRSELGKPAPVMAVSGYLSSDEEWAKFEPAWRQVLNHFEVEMFHMTEFECRLRPFESWTNETRVNLLGQLLDLVSRHTMAGIGAGILMNDYAGLSGEDQKLLGHPYAMRLKAVADTFRWIDDFITRRVAAGVHTETPADGPCPKLDSDFRVAHPELAHNRRCVFNIHEQIITERAFGEAGEHELPRKRLHPGSHKIEMPLTGAFVQVNVDHANDRERETLTVFDDHQLNPHSPVFAHGPIRRPVNECTRFTLKAALSVGRHPRESIHHLAKTDIEILPKVSVFFLPEKQRY
jgi:hypothetical protein